MPDGWVQLLSLVRADGLLKEGVPACEYEYLNQADGVVQQADPRHDQSPDIPDGWSQDEDLASTSHITQCITEARV